MSWIIVIIGLGLALPILRFVGGALIILVVVAVLALSPHEPSGTVVVAPAATIISAEPVTYQYLVNYPLNCDYADSQLAELKSIQQKFNFDQDPDQLSPDDRALNGIIKSDIWWFSYRCNKS
jgi:hypothetical protein